MAKHRIPPDLIQTEADKLAIEQGCYYSPDHVERFLKFAKLVIHSKGTYANQSFHLLEWEVEFARKLFGWRQKDGRRRFKSAFLFIQRGNGKSKFGSLFF